MVIQDFLLSRDSATVSQRKLAAIDIAYDYLSGELEFEEQCDAEAAITLLLDDPSEKVRYVLAEVLCTSAHAPQQVISAMVHDQYEIASLVIARSPIIYDSDLIARLDTAEDRLQTAIANRPQVSNVLARAIAQNGCAAACVALLNNFNADICAICRSDIASRHIDDAAIRGALLKQSELEADIRLKVMKGASAALAKMNLLSARRENGAAQKVMRDAEQRAMVTLASGTQYEQMDHLIDAMRDNGDLTTQMLIRATCQGKMDFFARVLSALSGETSQRVTSILVNERSTQLNALLARAGFSKPVQPVFAGAVSLWRQVAQGTLIAGAQEVTRNIIEHYEQTHQDDAQSAHNDIVALLRSIYLDMMRENARKHAVSLAEAA